MQYHYLYIVLPIIFVISVLIISIIIGGSGSWGVETITNQQKSNENRVINHTNANITINTAEQLTTLEKAPSGVNNVYANETLTFSRDEHENCSFWASIGECKKNPNFMLKGCRRSCDILLTSTISNEAPCMKAQREWYDDLRDEYLDHSTPDNVLRKEALFKMQFFQKIHDLIKEVYGHGVVGNEQDELQAHNMFDLLADSMFDLLNDDERLHFDKESMKLHQILMTGGKEYAINYNYMIYYLNVAKGTDYEYVTATMLNSESFDKFIIADKYNHREKMDGEGMIEHHTSSNGTSIGAITRRQAIDNITEYEGSFLQAEIKSAKLKGTEETVRSTREEEYFNSDELDKRAIMFWLYDLRDYMLGWSEQMAEETEPIYFQMYFVGKMVDLLVPGVVPEVDDEGIHAFSYHNVSFPKLNDIEKRDKVSAYMLSLLNDDERSKLLNGLDKFEENMSKSGIPYAFDFNNLMEFFIKANETIVEDEEAVQGVAEMDEDVQPSTWLEIESALTTKPNPELKDSWTWEDMSDVMLLDVCDQIGYSNGLEWMVNKAHLYNSLLQAAKECHVIQTLLGVLHDQYDDWMFIMNRRDALEYMISNGHVTDDEKSDLRAYFDEKLDSEVTREMPKENNTMVDDQVVEDESGMLQNLLDKVESLKLNEMAKFNEMDMFELAKAILFLLVSFFPLAFGLSTIDRMMRFLESRKDDIDYYSILIFGFIGKVIRMPYDLYWEKRMQTTLYISSSMSKKLAGKQGLESSSKNLSGRQGRKKNRFLNKSGVDDIQVDTSATGSSHVAVHLTGSRQSIKKAVAMIQEAVGIEHVSWKRNQSSHSNPMQEESTSSALIDDNDTSIDNQSKNHLTTVDDDNMSRKIDNPMAPTFITFIGISTVLRRGMKCLVVIPQMIHIGIGMMIRLPSKLIRDAIGIEHVSIDQPSNSSPQQAEAPQLGMSPSSAVLSGNASVDEKKVISIMDKKASLVTPLRKEEIPSEIGFDSSQALTCGTITEASLSGLNGLRNTDENNPLVVFLRSQHQCIRGNVDEFYIWLVKSEYIESMSALKEAVCDDVYYNDTMKRGSGSSGIKVFKRREFQRAVLEYEVLDDDQSLSQYESKVSNTNLSEPVSTNTNLNEPPEELVCPISLILMTKDPVVAADGITYERASIEDWFAKSKAKVSKAKGNLKENPHSEADQRVVDTGVCSPVYGSRVESLVLMPNTVVRNMARAYKEKKEE